MYYSRPQDIGAAAHFGFMSCTGNVTQHTELAAHTLTGSTQDRRHCINYTDVLFYMRRCYSAFGSLLYLMPDPFGARVSLFRPPAIFPAG